MHKKSRKHSGVVLVYSLLKKKTGAACPSISSLFPLFGEVGGGGGWVGWRTVPKYFALFPEREPGH